MTRRVTVMLLALAFVLAVAGTALADTIHMKDGTVIKGKVVAFKDQQFTVLVGNAARGRQSRLTVYIDDVDWIEFDPTPDVAGMGGSIDSAGSAQNQTSGNNTVRPNNGSSSPMPAQVNSQTSTPGPVNTAQTNSGNTNSAQGTTFVPLKPVRVLGDNTNNGWTFTEFVVKRGQRIRISASGRVMLGAGRFTTPAGLTSLPDKDKLLANDPTGALIAVIGDNNNEFIFIGAKREFLAPRDGYLFLGINESNLEDNTGAFDATIEVEAGTSPR